MTPLGHAGLSLLSGIALTNVYQDISPELILSAMTVGGTFLDLDLLYRFYQKGAKVFDKTIGKHRYFPSHTPLYIILVGIIIALISNLTGQNTIMSWNWFFLGGAFGHLLLDTLFFPEGVRFFYPFSLMSSHFLEIRTHPYWAPRPITGVNNWLINYSSSPLFFVGEAFPALIAIVLLLRLSI